MLNRSKNPIHETIVDIEGEDKDIKVEVALQYTEKTYSENILSFVNTKFLVEYLRTFCHDHHDQI